MPIIISCAPTRKGQGDCLVSHIRHASAFLSQTASISSSTSISEVFNYSLYIQGQRGHNLRGPIFKNPDAAHSSAIMIHLFTLRYTLINIWGQRGQQYSAQHIAHEACHQKETPRLSGDSFLPLPSPSAPLGKFK